MGLRFPLLSPALPLTPALLMLAACGDGAGSYGPAAPGDFELAAASIDAGAAKGEGRAVPAPALIELSPEQHAARMAAGNIRLIDLRTDEAVAEGVISAPNTFR